MKKLTHFVVFAILAFSTINAFAQKKEKKLSGTVVYGIESVGETPIPVNTNEQTIKLLDERVGLNNNMILINGRTMYQIQDLSQVQMMVQQLGVDFDYEGPWKIYLKNTITQEDLDSLGLNENYKITYLDETKTIVDVEAKKARVSIKGDEDTFEYDVWYTENMGPEYDQIFVPGLKGFPLEFTQNLGNGAAIKWTAKEINKKKMKEAEFLLPSGYEEISMEKFQDFMEKYQELMEDMQF